MAIYLDIKVSHGSDKLTTSQMLTVRRAARALSVALRSEEEKINNDGLNTVTTYMNNPIYPDALWLDGNDKDYTLTEAKEAIREQRKKDKIQGIQNIKILSKAKEWGIKY